MARRKSASPYFKSIHSPPPSPAPLPQSISIPPRYIRNQFTDSGEMVNFSKLDTKALIEAAIAPTTSQPGHQRTRRTLYTLEEPESFETTSRKRSHNYDQERLSDESFSECDSSGDTFISKPGKKQSQLIDDHNDGYDIPQHRLRNKDKGRAEHVNNNEEDEAAVAFQLVKPVKPKLMITSHKPSSSHKTSLVPKRRKSLATPVPNCLQNAHPADKELFKMKANGKPWKEIKVVWERLMNKSIGDSTLSVRYCKMKENFEKSGGKDDIRILKFKAKVEAELEASKWELVASMTEEDGGTTMTAKEVRLRFKEIERNDLQVSAGNSSDGLSKVTEADMDTIDRELAGVREVGTASESSELEDGDVDESRDLEPELRSEDAEIEGFTQAEQKSIENFGEANTLEGCELDGKGYLYKSIAVKDGALVGEESSKLGQEDSEKSTASGVEAGEGVRSITDEPWVSF